MLGELLREKEGQRPQGRMVWSKHLHRVPTPTSGTWLLLPHLLLGTEALYLLFPLLHAFLFSSCITFSGHFLSMEEIGLTFPKTT